MDINITTPTATQVDALKRDGSNANSDVDLGAYSLNANSVKINGTAGNGHIDLKHQSSDATSPASSTALWADANGDIKWKIDGNYKTILKTSGNNADRTYTFQNANGTLAFTSDIPSLAPYLTIAAAAAAYEPIFSKGTAFNRNFGTSSGDILLQTGTTANQILVTDSNNKVTSQAKGTAYNRNFGTSSGDILLIGSNTVANRVLITDSNNQVSTSSTTATQLGYLDATSSIQTQLNTRGEYFSLTSNTFNPADSTSYYLGYFVLAPNTAAINGRFTFMNTGLVTLVQVQAFITGTNGSNENVSIYLRNETAATETLLGTMTWDTGTNSFANSLFSCSISVPNTTDRWSLKIITPAWGTNPTNVYVNARIFNRT